MKQSLSCRDFVSGFHFSCRDFVSGFHFLCRDFVSGFHFSCREFTLRVGISLFMSGFHSLCRDLEHQYLPFSASILLCCISKVLERLIYDDFVVKSISSDQYGFLPKGSAPQ